MLVMCLRGRSASSPRWQVTLYHGPISKTASNWLTSYLVTSRRYWPFVCIAALIITTRLHGCCQRIRDQSSMLTTQTSAVVLVSAILRLSPTTCVKHALQCPKLYK